MTNKLQLSLKQDQRLTMSHQLRQAITLLQYGTLDLKQVVEDYLNENPLLEVDENNLANAQEEFANHYHSVVIHKTHEYENDQNVWENYSAEKSLRDHLHEQANGSKLTEVEYFIVETMIEAIDDNGRLTMSLEEIHEIVGQHYPVTVQVLDRLLSIIQGYEPIGVGHRNLQECLLLQLRALPSQDKISQLAEKAILSHLEDVTNFKKLQMHLKISQDDYSQVMQLIRRLNPKPGLLFEPAEKTSAGPELQVRKVGNKWQVYLTNSILTHVQINQSYKQFMKSDKKKPVSPELQKKLEEAQQLISGLKRRNQTLLEVGQCIVEAQSEFLDHGPSAMKPMNIADVAVALDIHESTVSRVTTEKYIATPRGIFELKYFFPSSLGVMQHNACSSIAVKEMIKEIIQAEQPGSALSDNEIVTELKNRGVPIARRTVAKYREAMRILPCHMRDNKKIA